MSLIKVKNLSEVKDRLNSVGKGFCPQKWRRLSLYLYSGMKHSCYHPAPHRVPLDRLTDPAVLHNTPHDLENRKLMLTGSRPEGCSYCWNIEDLDKNSDRFYRNNDGVYDLDEEIDILSNTPWNANVNPYVLEVAFSNLCNFKCGYCCPSSSSLWEKEIEKFGNYNLLFDQYGKNKIYSEDEYNPYIEAFWKWWPNLKNDLKIFRITGGEPLLSKYTTKLLHLLADEGNANLSLQFNTNMGVTNRRIVELCDHFNSLISSKHIKDIRLFTSLECVGTQAEYIRRGLNYELFLQNVDTYLNTKIGRAHV